MVTTVYFKESVVPVRWLEYSTNFYVDREKHDPKSQKGLNPLWLKRTQQGSIVPLIGEALDDDTLIMSELLLEIRCHSEKDDEFAS